MCRVCSSHMSDKLTSGPGVLGNTDTYLGKISRLCVCGGGGYTNNHEQNRHVHFWQMIKRSIRQGVDQVKETNPRVLLAGSARVQEHPLSLSLLRAE
jgi:hypothetical protein